MLQVEKEGFGIKPLIIDGKFYPSLTYKKDNFKVVINKKDKGSIWFEWFGTF
jgi:hypothetical protein